MSINVPTIQIGKYIPAIVLGMGAFIATFDVTAISLALPAISRSFSLDVAGAVWIMNSYSLAFTIMLIAAGAISDRFGDRSALLTGAVTFLIASVLCAFATSYGALIAGRVLQGIGAAFIVCGGYPLVGRLYSDKAERVQAFAIIGTIGGSALAIGPGLGGVIAGAFGWEWVFLINIPICLAIIAGSWGLDEHTKLRSGSLDVSGILTISTFLLASAWFLLNGPNVGGFVFNTPAFIVMLGLLLAAFIVVEMRTSHPALDISLFGRKPFLGLAIVPLCLAVSYWSLVVYMPLFFESSFQMSTESISYIMLFFTLPMFVVPYLVTGIALRARQSAFYAGGLFAVSVGCLWITVSAYLNAYGLAIMGMLVAGLGAASVQTQVSGALIASAPDDRAGAVSAIMTLLRQGGFAVGTAFLSNAMQVTIKLGPYSIDRFTVLFLVCAFVAGLGSAFTFFLIRSGENNHPTQEISMDQMLDNNRAAIEQKVDAIWQEIFQKGKANPGDNFFNIGGNSLTAVKFIVEIEKSYGDDALTPDQLYKGPTFDAIVSAIEANVRG